FATYIPGDKFPCAVLYLEMNPALVDVNVHPAKLEVKFSNERLVFESVYYAVRGALENRLDRPELKMLEKRAKEQSAKESIFAFAPGKEGRGGEKTQSVKDMRRTIDEGVTGPQKEPTAAAFADSEAFPAIKKTEEHPATEAPIPAAPTPAFAGEQIPPPAEAPAPAEPTDSAIPPLPTEPPMSDDAVVSIPPLEIAKKNPAAAAPVPERVPEQKEIRKERTESAFSYMKIPPLPGKQQPREPEKVPEKQPEKTEEKQIPQYRMVGEVFQCYVILECGDTMYLVDKHAAHERILFEEFKACGRQSEQCSQMLLMPLEVSLTREEADAARDFADDIENSGFSFSIHGTTAEIDRIPAFLDTAQAMDAFCEACTRLAEHTGTAELTRELRYEKALFQASCKAAIKAGRNYDPAHLKWICDRVLSDPEIRYCPHGRPVCFEMTKAMVENRFGRT
ncbi:MAG: hypothetical protein MJ175_10280, partial [Clostridia bacterium]|nr:hypothetical protein [Clostridia bacterium]